MNKKDAFCMVEILMVLSFIGIIIVLETIILQNRINQYSAPYFNAYNSLTKAAYNVLADMYCPDSGPNAICPDGPRAFPTTPENLCSRLTEFINTAGAANIHCSAQNINNNASNFSEDSVKFVASNSFKYYISSLKKVEVEDETINYFIVYIDLNGNSKPNRVGMKYETNGGKITPIDKIYPDIVPFAVTTRGEVVPMGYPVYSNMYLTARVKYPASVIEGEINDDRYSPMMTFNDAARKSWGNGEYSDIPFSINFTKLLPTTSEARKFYNIPADNSVSIAQNEGCSAGNYTCRVIVDVSDQKRY